MHATQMNALKKKLEAALRPDKLCGESASKGFAECEGRLDEAVEGIRRAPEQAWQAGLVEVLMSSVGILVKVSKKPERVKLDPSEGLLYAALDGLIVAYESLSHGVDMGSSQGATQGTQHEEDELAALVKRVSSSEALANLVFLVVDIEGHDAEVLELAGMLLAAMFHGRKPQRFSCRQEFFNGAHSKVCARLLRDPLTLILKAKTFTYQMAILDALVMVGKTGQEHRKKAFEPYIDSIDKLNGAGFMKHAPALLCHLNSEKETAIVSVQCAHVRVFGKAAMSEGERARIHFNANGLSNLPSEEAPAVKYTSLVAAAVKQLCASKDPSSESAFELTLTLDPKKTDARPNTIQTANTATDAIPVDGGLGSPKQGSRKRCTEEKEDRLAKKCAQESHFVIKERFERAETERQRMVDEASKLARRRSEEDSQQPATRRRDDVSKIDGMIMDREVNPDVSQKAEGSSSENESSVDQSEAEMGGEDESALQPHDSNPNPRREEGSNMKEQASLPTKLPRSTRAQAPPKATAFNQFVAARRPRVLASNPNASLTEVRTILSAAWKKMDANEKRPWAQKAENLNRKRSCSSEGRSPLEDQGINEGAGQFESADPSSEGVAEARRDSGCAEKESIGARGERRLEIETETSCERDGSPMQSYTSREDVLELDVARCGVEPTRTFARLPASEPTEEIGKEADNQAFDDSDDIAHASKRLFASPWSSRPRTEVEGKHTSSRAAAKSFPNKKASPPVLDEGDGTRLELLSEELERLFMALNAWKLHKITHTVREAISELNTQQGGYFANIAEKKSVCEGSLELTMRTANQYKELQHRAKALQQQHEDILKHRLSLANASRKALEDVKLKEQQVEPTCCLLM
ncbi:hypothetical protein AB1Y20_015987 [Prymnesium parvum]|uniref:HMG box domain-containing protein n=1 Tax=Prymnesium parvum TaxID=97485 RepID=A0AB34JZC8_PRYPA